MIVFSVYNQPLNYFIQITCTAPEKNTGWLSRRISILIVLYCLFRPYMPSYFSYVKMSGLTAGPENTRRTIILNRQTFLTISLKSGFWPLTSPHAQLKTAVRRVLPLCSKSIFAFIEPARSLAICKPNPDALLFTCLF
jgi:hypothetical protein